MKGFGLPGAVLGAVAVELANLLDRPTAADAAGVDDEGDPVDDAPAHDLPGEASFGVHGGGALAPVHRFFPLPVPLGDPRSSILGDPVARRLPEMLPESPVNDPRPRREGMLPKRARRARVTN